MSATTIAYHLRPNKAIEREVFLDLLGMLAPVLPLKDYRYVGLGGPFLEDFRLIEKRIGPKKLSCIERDPDTHARQVLNCASPRVECLRGTFEELVPQMGLEDDPAIVWLDYSDLHDGERQIQSFVDLAETCKEYSIIKVTLPARPPQEGEKEAKRETRLRKALGAYYPSGISLADLAKPTYYATALLRAVELAFSRAGSSITLTFRGLTSFVYSDGTLMTTVTGVLVPPTAVDAFFARTHLRDWQHLNDDVWNCPQVIDVPVLSLLEQRMIAQHAGRKTGIGFAMPPGRLCSDPLENFQRYARLYPQFARVEL